MLVILHSQGFPKEITTGENLGKRFGKYKKKCKEALNVKNDSRSGLTEVEILQGLTIEEKLNKICPHFEHMHNLHIGERANVALPTLGATGMLDHLEVYHDLISDDEFESGNYAMDYVDARAQNQAPTETIVTQQMDGIVEENQPREFTATTENFMEATTYEAVDHPCATTSNPAQPARVPSPPPPVVDGHSPTTLAPAPSTNGTTAQKKKRPAPVASAATSRTNMVDLYAEKLSDKNGYRVQMIETKDKWRTQELPDRREARAATAKHSDKKDCVQRKHEDKRAKKDRQHQLQLIQAEQTMKLLTELFKNNRTEQEMHALMSLIGNPSPTENRRSSNECGVTSRLRHHRPR